MDNVGKGIKIQIFRPFETILGIGMSQTVHYVRDSHKTHYFCTAAQVQVLY